MLGIGALCLFIILGVLTVWRLFQGLGRQTRLWLGAALGFVELMWLPSLFAFFFRFTALAQYWALGTAAGLAAAALFLPRARELPGQNRPSEPPLSLSLALVLPLVALSAYLQYTHTLRELDGALYVGQSTYGDLCLHLGIATGLRGAAYPPEYTLLPGAMLGYPFLFDALSASLLVLGTPLAPAFLVPSVLAMGLVYWGFVHFAWSLTRDRRAVTIAYLLLFLNGGLGFLYVLDGMPADPSRLHDALLGFYRAPANMPEYNLRWVNVVCDLLIPQRTLLAGWLMVMPALYLLNRAQRTGRRGLFAALGVWAGLMPMVHTHSFLALGLISLGAMVYQLIAQREARKQILVNYLLYGGTAALLALPQLLTWTFPQTVGGGSLRLWFNWVNNDGQGSLIDGYFWFWIKNVGPVYLLLLPAALSAPKRARPLLWGALLIYVVAELVLFQPNVYDNNKLFVVAFLAVLPLVARFLTRLWDRMRGVRGRWMLASAFLIVCLLSGAMSMLREGLSSYQLLGADEVRAARYVEEHAERDAVVLTGTQHNNAVAALTGRSIVCGTGSYLFYHGVDYAAQQAAVWAMYERPEASRALFERYGVGYIYLSSQERGQFEADEAALRRMFPVWYEEEGVTIFRVERSSLLRRRSFRANETFPAVDPS